jgi:ketosteroid isomerase-like protein
MWRGEPAEQADCGRILAGARYWRGMSQNSEIVGRVLRRFSDQDIDGLPREAHPEIKLDYSESNAPDASVYRGHAACRAFLQGRYEDFDDRSFDAVELIDAPPNAVIAVGLRE